jgi:Domain of Unknown Function (DUF1259)
MKSLLDGGFEITAIHNHLLRGSMPVWYMHVGAHGRPETLAATARQALDAILGFKGTANGGVYQFSVPRTEMLKEGGMELPVSMGTATAINFQPTGAGKAAITGDFVLLGTEVQPVLGLLRRQGVEVTALHSHMVDETPRLYFMHFWANDDAGKLARTLREAINLTNSRHGG